MGHPPIWRQSLIITVLLSDSQARGQIVPGGVLRSPPACSGRPRSAGGDGPCRCSLKTVGGTLISVASPRWDKNDHPTAVPAAAVLTPFSIGHRLEGGVQAELGNEGAGLLDATSARGW